MAIDLEELERLAAQTTPRPWATEDLYNITHYDEAHEWHGIVIQADICGKIIPSEANAAYIVAACNAVPSLIARVRELEETVITLQIENDTINELRAAHWKQWEERVRELERQREFFLRALNDNRLCPNGGCFHDGSDLDEWDCTSYDNRECWIQAAKEAGKCP